MKPKQRKLGNGWVVSLVLGVALTWVLGWLIGTGSTVVARAATFSVTKFTDSNDGICDADCSLREAIIAANAAGNPDTITLPAGFYSLTIAGAGEDAAATGDLDITTPLTIMGAGPDLTIIDAGGLDRVFEMHSGTIVIADLTIRNGDAGGYVYGGGIYNEADLTLSNSVVHNNRANSGGGIVNHNSGSLTLRHSSVITNTTSGNGGGVVNFSTMTLTHSIINDNLAGVGGGGIYNTTGSDLTVTNSSVSSNTASSGGGIANSGGELVLTHSNISHNQGDGIFNTSGSNLVLTHSTVSSNTGDGIANLDAALTVRNSTISQNTASVGAGIANFSSGIVTVTHSTISHNTFRGLGGGINNYSGTVTLKNTIVADNSDTDCRGTITSHGHNLDRDNSCGLTTAGDLADTNPILGPLQNNGGDTATHALLAGSPAIDTADNGACPVTDQRGFMRPFDGDRNGSALCDMGAYEFDSPGPTVTVTPTIEPPTATPAPRLHVAIILVNAAAPTDQPIITDTPTNTPTPTATHTPTDTPTPTNTPTDTLTPTATPVPNRPPDFTTPLETSVMTKHEYDQFGWLLGAVTTMTISAASDPDGDPITYTWSATNGTIIGNGLTATWTRVIRFGQVQGGDAVIAAADNHGSSGTYTFKFE